MSLKTILIVFVFALGSFAANAQCTHPIVNPQLNHGVLDDNTFSQSVLEYGHNWSIFGQCLSNGSGSSVTLRYPFFTDSNTTGIHVETFSSLQNNFGVWFESASQINIHVDAPLGPGEHYLFTPFEPPTLTVCDVHGSCDGPFNISVDGPRN